MRLNCHDFVSKIFLERISSSSEQQRLGVGYFIIKLVAGESQLNKIPDQKFEEYVKLWWDRKEKKRPMELSVPENPWKKLKERMKLNEKRAKRIYLCDVNLETLLKEPNW